VLKISSFGLEHREKKHLARPIFHRNLALFSRRQHATVPPLAKQRAAHNRLVCIGGVKLAGLDNGVVRRNHACQPSRRL